MKLFGYNIRSFLKPGSVLRFQKEMNEFYLQGKNQHLFNKGKLYPILNEKNTSAGNINGHYFNQDLFVAKKIYENKPVKHVDIGSRIDGFVAHLAVFREVEIFDIRYKSSDVKNIVFKQSDFTVEIDRRYHNYCDSISSLHAIEHFGLGRYGDKIDYFGDKKALKNIFSMLKTGGIFYFSVPIGPQRVEFNAHRVYSVSYLLKFFMKNYELISFSYIDDMHQIHEDVKLEECQIENNFGCNFGCGIFQLKKL